MNFYATKVSMGGFKVFDVVTFCALLYLLKYFLIDNYLNKKYFHFILFFAFIIVALIGAFVSEQPNSALVDVLKILPIFIYCRFLVLECIQDSSFHSKVVKTLKIVFGIALLFLSLQLIFGLKFSLYSTLNINTFDPIRGVIRYPGYFHDSQVQGQFFALGCILLLYNGKNLHDRNKIYYVLSLMCLFAVYISGSRSALLGLLVAGFIALLLIGRKYLLFILGAGILVVGVMVYQTNQSFSFGRTSTSTEDLKFRQTIWVDAYNIALKHPMFGIGSGNYLGYTMKHNPNQYFELENNEIAYFDQPENGYLKILVEFGFVGFTIFGLMIVAPILKSLFSFFLRRSDKSIIFIFSALLSWIIAFNTVYSIMDIRMLIMVATLFVLLITYPKNQISGEEN
ncbi:MAG: O-antigen ligase domain-containing protein [Pedobacter sp.]|nr:MAG: O-antigen ligase domain-containing protein [Pedobacter sp.]